MKWMLLGIFIMQMRTREDHRLVRYLLVGAAAGAARAGRRKSGGSTARACFFRGGSAEAMSSPGPPAGASASVMGSLRVRVGVGYTSISARISSVRVW